MNRSALAKNIIARRKALSLSQTTLAEKAEVTVNTIKNIERGASKGSTTSLKNIALALGCGVDDLYQKGHEIVWQNMTQRQLAELLAEALRRAEGLESANAVLQSEIDVNTAQLEQLQSRIRQLEKEVRHLRSVRKNHR